MFDLQGLAFDMDSKKLSRAALGSIASLGDLYDARTDSFLKISIFNRQIPEETLTLVDNHFSDIQLIHSDSYSEKFNKLNIKADLQVSFLAGLLNLQGSGEYLSDKKASARTVKSSLLYNIKTKEESINIFHVALKDVFALEAIESECATHVVVGISWGANSILSCEYLNTDNNDAKQIEGKLTARLKEINISGGGLAEFTEGYNNKDLQFNFRMYGDVLPSNENLPTTFEEALHLIKKMPSYVENSNQGRGKPLTYSLIPLSILLDYLKLPLKVDRMIKYLEEDALLRIVQLFESLSTTQQEINDFYQDATTHRFCIEAVEFEKIASIKQKFEIEEAKFRSNLSSKLTAVRSGKAVASDLDDLITQFRSQELSPEKVIVQLHSLSHITEKVSFANSLILNGAKYIGNGASLDEEIVKNLGCKTYTFYFKNDAKTSNIDKWTANRQIFLQEMKKNADGTRFFAVDCDIHPNLWPKNGISVQVLEVGKILCENLLKEYETVASTAMARCTLPMTKSISKPNKRVNLVIPCTGKNCKPNVDFDWICPKCEENIEFGFDEMFYCSCGHGPSDSYEFKCTDAKHGPGYDLHNDKKFLKELLSRLRPFKEINILILGETGVGKSTWINGFQSYLKYESLQEAEQNELCSLIPSKFTICDEYYNNITIFTGEDQNEVQTTGQSATQGSKVYSFMVDDTVIRLIDTPGVGDTRGIDQDKKNFENILGTLSYLDELHGICILLKPNNSRLTVMFKFCIKELLTYLHRDASKNIMFCFTNSRGTFYRPGDTMPVLKDLLDSNKNVEIPISNHTVYCFDSEAYRFLAAVKNKDHPIKFLDEERENFAKSWEKSIAETQRMLKHISELTPHTIKSTLSLNSARELVQKLTRPMAEISKNIQINIAINIKHSKEIMMTKADIIDLEKKKTFEREELEIVAISYPKTVCTNVKCKKIYGPDNFKQIDYVTVCHAPCSLSGVSHDTVGDEKLLDCDCITNGNCNRPNCGHSYREHMHIYYDSKAVKKRVVNEAVKELLESTLSAAEIKEKMIDAKNKETEEFKQVYILKTLFLIHM